MYPDDEPFTAYEGSTSLKVFGQFYTGNASETPIYQEFTAAEGETYTFEGWAWMYGNDAIGEERTYANLWIKYFDDSYTYYGEDSSGVITSTSTTDTWTQLTVTGTVPEGATKVQASIQFMHCTDVTDASCYDGGGVYFDDMLFYKHESE